MSDDLDRAPMDQDADAFEYRVCIYCGNELIEGDDDVLYCNNCSLYWSLD